MIHLIRPENVGACADIYNYYIINTTATLEYATLTAEAFGKRVANITARFPYLVFEENDEILGYAYLSDFNTRYAYRFTCDLSIYVAPKARGRKIGEQLYHSIEKIAVDMGFWNVMSLITSVNEPSLAFHTRMGFEKQAEIGHVAYKFGKWVGLCFYCKRLRLEGNPEELIDYRKKEIV